MGGFVAPLTGQLNAALTNFVKGFRQNGLISDLVCPRVPVERETDTYYIWDRRDQQLLQQTLRHPGDGAQSVRRTLSTDTYHARSHALKTVLPDESRVNAEQVGLGASVSQQGRAAFLQKLLLLDKEQAMADLVTAVANVTQNTTPSGSDQWTDPSSDPSAVIETAKSTIRLSGVEANTLVIGESVYRALKAHPKVMAAFQYVQKGIIGVAEIASYFDVPRVEVARAVKVSGADVASFIFPATDALLFYSDQGAGSEDISFAKTFVWNQAPGTIGGYGVVIGRDPDPTAKTDIVGADMYYHQKITAVETAYLIKTATAS